MSEKEKEIEMVTISVAEYNRLKKNDNWLNCLEDAGVDNWDGYDYALELLGEQKTTSANK